MGNSGRKPDLMDVAIDLKMTCRQLENQSKKLEQLEKTERKKIVDVRSPSLTSLGFEQRTDG